MRLLGTKLGSISTGRGLGDSLYDNAGASPSLDQRFAESKSLTDAVSGQNLITFTRATTGTFANSQGQIETAAIGAPRFDHSPTTGESLGLLVEEQRTNLLSSSEDFLNDWGLALATRTADQGTAPNGTLTADRVASTGGGVFRAGQGVVNATVYTYSVFLKHVSGTGVMSNVGFERFGSTPLPAQSSFNLLTGAVVSNGSSVTTSTITSFGNGWHRVSVTATSTDVTATIINYASASGNQFLIWGAQLEAGAFPTSYIPTTTTSATRAADVANITGSNFSSWYRQDEGTVFMGYQTPSNPANNFAAQISDNSYANRIVVGQDSVTAIGQVVVASSVTLQPTVSPARSNNAIRQVFGYASNSAQMSANGALAVEDALGAMTTALSRLDLGSDQGGFNRLSGTIRRLTYWPARLPNSTLQALTQ